ncbi:MAG: hypothetical protein VX498_11400 [Myxococcota bacterium]|nr:hypothetical protein [Myxococcota bacterium]
MPQNVTRILLVMLAVGGLSLLSTPRSADAVSLNLINTWRMTDLGGLGGNGAGALPYRSGRTGDTLAPAFSSGAFPEGGINIHVGIGLGKTEQVVPFIGLGLQRRQYTFEGEDLVADDEEGEVLETANGTGSALQVGLEIGSKIYFMDRSQGSAPPFLMFSVYKYLGQVVDDVDTGDAYLQEELGAFGFKVSFGAEYCFNDRFALGADFFGLNFSTVTAVGIGDNDRDVRNQVSLFTGLNLTYRIPLSAGSTVKWDNEYDYED